MTETQTAEMRTPIRRQSIHDAIRTLQTFVARMERRYECSSEEMEADVAEGRMRDTAEVELWSMRYQRLKKLQARVKQHQKMSGSPTKTTV